MAELKFLYDLNLELALCTNYYFFQEREKAESCSVILDGFGALSNPKLLILTVIVSLQLCICISLKAPLNMSCGILKFHCGVER